MHTYTALPLPLRVFVCVSVYARTCKAGTLQRCKLRAVKIPSLQLSGDSARATVAPWYAPLPTLLGCVKRLPRLPLPLIITGWDPLEKFQNSKLDSVQNLKFQNSELDSVKHGSFSLRPGPGRPRGPGRGQYHWCQ